MTSAGHLCGPPIRKANGYWYLPFLLTHLYSVYVHFVFTTLKQKCKLKIVFVLTNYYNFFYKQLLCVIDHLHISHNVS